MEEILAVYETNWSLFGVDGQSLPGPPSPLSEQWHQEDDLKICMGGPSDGAPSMMDQLVSVQQALEPEDQDEPWLDSKTDIVELLLAGDEVAKSESSVSESHDTELAPVTSTPFVPIVSEDEAIEQLIESLERPVPDGIIDLDNGQVGSQSLLELLTNDIGEHNEAVHLTADDIESILSSNPSSPVGSTDDSFDSDPDWSPSDSYSSQSTSRSKQTFVIQSPVPSRPAPYEKQGRSVYSKADKKLRKKEQNRTAATRYRQKKKKEQDCTMDEYLELETKNKDLKDKVDSISQEIAYLKKLMADVYKARKQLKN